MSEHFTYTVLDAFVSFNIPHIFGDDALRKTFNLIIDPEYYQKVRELRKEKKFILGFIRNVGAVRITYSDFWYKIFKAFRRKSNDISEYEYECVDKNYLPPLVPLRVISRHAVKTHITSNESQIQITGKLRVFIYPIGTGVIRVKFPIIPQVDAKTIIEFMGNISNNKINVFYRNKERKFVNFLATIKKNILKSLFNNEKWNSIYFNLSEIKFALHLGGANPVSLRSSENKAMIAGFLRLEQDYQALSEEMITTVMKSKLMPFLKGDLFYFSKRVALAYTPFLFRDKKYARSRKRFRRRFFLGVELAHMVDYALSNVNDITTYLIANSLEKVPIFINILAISLNPYLLGSISIETNPGLLVPYSVEKFFIEQSKAIDLYDKYEKIVINFSDLIRDLMTKDLCEYIDNLSAYTLDRFSYAFNNLCYDLMKMDEICQQDEDINYSDKLTLKTNWMKVLNYLADAYVSDQNLESRGMISQDGWRTISAISKATKISRDLFYKHKTKGRKGIISLLQEEQLVMVEKRGGSKSKREITYVRINPNHKISKFIITMIEKQREKDIKYKQTTYSKNAKSRH
ncbi:MAG: hypothetical protein ACP6IU_13895 [Candidatus Asgardarchaeia archaeon]